MELQWRKNIGRPKGKWLGRTSGDSKETVGEDVYDRAIGLHGCVYRQISNPRKG